MLLQEEDITNQKLLDTIHQVYKDHEKYQKAMASQSSESGDSDYCRFN